MQIQPTPIADCYILIPKVFQDERGYFFERYNQKVFEKLIGKPIDFVQDNESLSVYGVIRGLHAQKGKAAQAKLVSVSKGKILDVVVDNRPDSETYKEVFSIELSEENKKQIFVPKGLLHGFAVLSEEAKFIYKCDEFYDPEAEIGIRYDDPQLNIDWEIPVEKRIISEKDQHLPLFKDLEV
ncbi:MAG TPA: dTDP-4-dehydrorhamnose 3,5-epimerase [Flavobacteriaceae bacterium]|nr:dTDP-4-dehydrorhamnose 3,5-epimerase [Flavobacteriaceae bacterium]